MSTEDRRIAEHVRRVLTSYWVDLTELRFTCTRGTLRFTGILRRLPSADRNVPLSAPLLEVITQEIKRLRGVARVYFTGVTIDECWVDAEAVEKTQKLRLIDGEFSDTNTVEDEEPESQL